jgi:ribosomal protein L29
LIDSVLRLTLLLRGRVPGGYTGAVQQAYASTPHHDDCFYYGHVSRDAGYVVLQYWYFYAMNDWRSSFGGVNDHESDWEQVTVFLVDRGDHQEPVPAWVAFSSHDEVGDDLRRRWDDPDMERAGTHPVVYAGAGSHSGAYLPGEYLVTAAVPLPGWLDAIRRTIARLLPWGDESDSVIGIPYIDYRRGDGLAVGEGGDRSWRPVLVDDTTPWVRSYRGLWGLDTRDPLGGERAPAGPRYERSARVRQSWGQPVAWAGLDKEAPTPEEARTDLVDGAARVRAELEAAEAELDGTRALLRAARAGDRADGRPPGQPGTASRDLQARVDVLREQQARLRAQQEGAAAALVAPLPDEDVHAHLRHRALPLTSENTPQGRLLRVWSAASTSVLLAAIGAFLLLGDGAILWPLVWIGVAMLLIEAVLRGRFAAVVVALGTFAVVVVIVWAAVELVLGNLRIGIGAILLLVALYMAGQTVREGIAIR